MHHSGDGGVPQPSDNHSELEIGSQTFILILSQDFYFLPLLPPNIGKNI